MSAAPSQRAQSTLPGFKEQTPYDPYLPSSPDEERLTKVNANPASTISSTERGRGHSQGHPPGHDGTARVDSNLSADQGMSRTDTLAFEEFEPQGFENPLLCDPGFDTSGAFYDPDNMSLFHQNSFKRSDTNRTEEPLSASTSKGTNFSRRSTGIATLSSQLMSPVPTEAASPEVAIHEPPSRDATKLLGGDGDMSRVSSQSTATAGNYTSSLSMAQRTPALTTTSVDLTPSLADEQHPFPPTTPTIQVDYHQRGDSPMRGTVPAATQIKRRAEDDNSAGRATENRAAEMIQRVGQDPKARGDAPVISLEDQTKQQELDAKNSQVSHWLSVNTADDADPNTLGPPAGLRPPLRPGGRRRAASNSNPSDLPAEVLGFSQGLQAHANARIPGPGCLLDEVSADGLEDDEDDATHSFVESAPASVDGEEAMAKVEELDHFPPLEVLSPEQESRPWADPIYMPSYPGVRGQPETANAAMQRFLNRARDIETASRVATWGTQRRKSDGDLHFENVFGSGGLLARLSISKERDRTEPNREEWRSFRETIERAADRIRTVRTNSTSKRKGSEPARPTPEKAQSYDNSRRDSSYRRKDSSASGKNDRKDSVSSKTSVSPSILGRIPSGGKRPKSPRIDTSGIAAITTTIGALGAGSISPTRSIPTSVGFFGRAKERLSFHHHHHHVSESPEPSHPSSPPEVTHPAAPAIPQVPAKPIEVDEDAEADDGDHPVAMEITPSKSSIIPTFDGFKAQVKETNPRLPTFLVERLGQEQLRRYKKLVQFKVEHAKHKAQGTCPSGEFCVDRGGQPKYFPIKNSVKETLRTGDEDEDDEAVADGIVSEAQFPAGLPMPPAKRLPAEFECPLCFQVKKFQKPSDWSKHVHEDLQPFTCTFTQCAEPKSFKRKADWVRHENERHRQLEWWQCSEDGCSHLCYRRDNFVQHLVREHKLPEPKAKNPRPNKPAVRGPAKMKPKAKGDININEVPLEERVLYMVEVCRRETNKDSMQEPCRFCGNHCNSFKKLTVHLARHMEALSLPVLELVKFKDVSPDTIISPIEIKLAQHGLSPVEGPRYDGQMIVNTGYPPGLDVESMNAANLGMTPVMTTGFQQPVSYAGGTGWSAHTTAHIPGTAGATAYAGEMSNAWTTTPPTSMFAQGDYTGFGTPAHYIHPHNSVTPDMYAMNSGPASTTHSPPQPVYAMHVDQRPHFHNPQYNIANGTSEGAGFSIGTEPANSGAYGNDGAVDGLGMQYDGATATGYAHEDAGNTFPSPPQGGMYAAQAPQPNDGRYYGY